jgi:hypothetical protein
MTEATTIAFPIVNRRHAALDRASQIHATALELFACKFVACRDEQDFTAGTLLAWLHRNGKFKEAHIQAARRVIEELKLAVGRSDVRANAGNDSHDRLRILIDEILTQEDRLLFIDVFAKDYFKPGSATLIEIGRTLTGFQGKDTAPAAAVGRVQALLERIGAYYADL